MKNVLVVGSGSLLEYVSRALLNSEEKINLSILTDEENETLKNLAVDFKIGSILNNTAVASYAIAQAVDLVIIAAENILWAGMADVLRQMNLPVFGPDKVFARAIANFETINSLFVDYKIKGIIPAQSFTEQKTLFTYLDSLQKDFVLETDKSLSNTEALLWGKDFSDLTKAKELAVNFLQLGLKVIVKKIPSGSQFCLTAVLAGEEFINGKPMMQGGGNLEADDLAEAVRISKSLAVALKKKFVGDYKGLFSCYFYLTPEGVQLSSCSSLPTDDVAKEFFARFEARTSPLKPDRLDFYRLASATALK